MIQELQNTHQQFSNLEALALGLIQEEYFSDKRFLPPIGVIGCYLRVRGNSTLVRRVPEMGHRGRFGHPKRCILSQD